MLCLLLSPEDVGVGAGAVLQRLAGARLGARPLLDGARRRREADVGVHARVDVTAGRGMGLKLLRRICHLLIQ